MHYEFYSTDFDAVAFAKNQRLSLKELQALHLSIMSEISELIKRNISPFVENLDTASRRILSDELFLDQKVVRDTPDTSPFLVHSFAETVEALLAEKASLEKEEAILIFQIESQDRALKIEQTVTPDFFSLESVAGEIQRLGSFGLGAKATAQNASVDLFKETLNSSQVIQAFKISRALDMGDAVAKIAADSLIEGVASIDFERYLELIERRWEAWRSATMRDGPDAEFYFIVREKLGESVRAALERLRPEFFLPDNLLEFVARHKLWTATFPGIEPFRTNAFFALVKRTLDHEGNASAVLEMWRSLYLADYFFRFLELSVTGLRKPSTVSQLRADAALIREDLLQEVQSKTPPAVMEKVTTLFDIIAESYEHSVKQKTHEQGSEFATAVINQLDAAARQVPIVYKMTNRGVSTRHSAYVDLVSRTIQAVSDEAVAFSVFETVFAKFQSIVSECHGDDQRVHEQYLLDAKGIAGVFSALMKHESKKKAIEHRVDSWINSSPFRTGGL